MAVTLLPNEAGWPSVGKCMSSGFRGLGDQSASYLGSGASIRAACHITDRKTGSKKHVNEQEPPFPYLAPTRPLLITVVTSLNHFPASLC